MATNRFGRRELLRAGVGLLFTGAAASAKPGSGSPRDLAPTSASTQSERADVTVRIGIGLIEIAPQRILSTATYNGQFPGPLLRLREGRRITVDIYNDTDTPEQLHWHGQFVPPDVDGAAEERTPYIPAHGMRRISFVPKPSGFRFYHTHVRGGGNLHRGQYTGQVGPIYIEPAHEPGAYDREVFLVLKEFEPFFSQGGDVAQDFLTPATEEKDLMEKGESAMRASLARGMPHGYEVGYRLFTINGKMLGHGEPVRVKQGERVLFHVLNGSATEIRSLALPGHRFRVVALDGNPVPNPQEVPVLWLGTAERVSAIVEMNHPGVWVMGDLGDDDRNRGMGIVVEYAGRNGKPQWVAPPAAGWSYTLFGSDLQTQLKPDEIFEMTFAKDNAADGGFNRWTINGVAFDQKTMPVMFHLKHGKRYRLRMRNASDDIHPVHLHRHTFEVTKYAGKQTSKVKKDVIMVGGYQEAEVDFTADDPGLTLFHCHQLLHMDFGFMALFDYV
jgi:FtsP/CotA-like multicopper oxidase with cupredoxin domain